MLDLLAASTSDFHRFGLLEKAAKRKSQSSVQLGEVILYFSFICTQTKPKVSQLQQNKVQLEERDSAFRTMHSKFFIVQNAR